MTIELCSRIDSLLPFKNGLSFCTSKCKFQGYNNIKKRHFKVGSFGFKVGDLKLIAGCRTMKSGLREFAYGASNNRVRCSLMNFMHIRNRIIFLNDPVLKRW